MRSSSSSPPGSPWRISAPGSDAGLGLREARDSRAPARSRCATSPRIPPPKPALLRSRQPDLKGRRGRHSRSGARCCSASPIGSRQAGRRGGCGPGPAHSLAAPQRACRRVRARLPRHHRDPSLPRPTQLGPVRPRHLCPGRGYRAAWSWRRRRRPSEKADSLSRAFLVLLEELTPLGSLTPICCTTSSALPSRGGGPLLGPVAGSVPTTRSPCPCAC